MRITREQIKHWLSNLSTGLLATIMLLTIFLGYGSINNRFYRIITIQGNSMSPTMYYGDAMVVTPPHSNLKPGTIVMMDVNGNLVTHRLLGYAENGAPITQGDANQQPDQFENSRISVVGVYLFHIPKLGYINLLLKQLAGNLGG